MIDRIATIARELARTEWQRSVDAGAEWQAMPGADPFTAEDVREYPGSDQWVELGRRLGLFERDAHLEPVERVAFIDAYVAEMQDLARASDAPGELSTFRPLEQPHEPFSYTWKAGDSGGIATATAEAYGLGDTLVDVVQVEAERVLVDGGDGTRAWLPRSLLGRTSDFGIIDDRAHFAAQRLEK